MINSAIGKWISTTCLPHARENYCFNVKWVQGSLLYHCTMTLAVIFDESSRSMDKFRFAEGEGELFVCVEHFGLERPRIIRADSCGDRSSTVDHVT